MSDNSRDILLYLLSRLETRPIFPKVYEGFREIDELAKAEDDMADVMRDCVNVCASDKFVTLMNASKLTAWEHELGLSGSGLTIDERRQQLVDYLNRSRVINDSTLHSLCQSLAPDYTVYERTDPDALSLGIFTVEEDEQGNLPAVGIVKEIMPTVPQNLALYVGVDTAFDRQVVVNHAHFTSMRASLGTVERIIPPHTLFNIIDTVTGEDTQCREPPDIQLVDKGGTMFDGAKDIITINGQPRYPTVDKGGSMFNGAKGIDTVQHQYGFGTIDKT